jgi:hypothetical protein
MQHISNYRATALSNASSTILELVFKPYLENEDPAICITLVLHHSYPHVYVQLHLNSVLNATPNIAATSLLCTFLKSIQHYYLLQTLQ